ncbi:hypothetical protein ACFSL6_08725 [Paenibacillus thailandensis]|uniref:Uncharacterized protein n=1 Tax=Paenibacillus thailandensis TaxID=393250 RepID=A0ABW5QSS6_9BACL
MRSLLAAVLLLVTVLILYEGVAKGDEGLNGRVKDAGEAVHSYIKGM